MSEGVLTPGMFFLRDTKRGLLAQRFQQAVVSKSLDLKDDRSSRVDGWDSPQRLRQGCFFSRLPFKDHSQTHLGVNSLNWRYFCVGWGRFGLAALGFGRVVGRDGVGWAGGLERCCHL